MSIRMNRQVKCMETGSIIKLCHRFTIDSGLCCRNDGPIFLSGSALEE